MTITLYVTSTVATNSGFLNDINKYTGHAEVQGPPCAPCFS